MHVEKLLDENLINEDRILDPYNDTELSNKLQKLSIILKLVAWLIMYDSKFQVKILKQFREYEAIMYWLECINYKSDESVFWRRQKKLNQQKAQMIVDLSEIIVLSEYILYQDILSYYIESHSKSKTSDEAHISELDEIDYKFLEKMNIDLQDFKNYKIPNFRHSINYYMDKY